VGVWQFAAKFSSCGGLCVDIPEISQTDDSFIYYSGEFVLCWGTEFVEAL